MFIKLKMASMLVIVGLLGLLFGVGMAVLTSLDLPPKIGLPVAGIFALVVVGIQYLIGPFLIDWLLKINWTTGHAVSPEFGAWYASTSHRLNIGEPRFGVIDDGMPNAFTYGHHAGNSRVVVTRGLIDVLSPEELKAVVAHELGHIKHRDFIMMTLVQALVLALYAMARISRGGNDRNLWVVVGSWIAYYVSYFVSLIFSRIREYMADYASAQVMSDPNPLSSALVKIAYGLAQTQPVTSRRAPATQPAPQYQMPQAPAPGSYAYAGQGAVAGIPPMPMSQEDMKKKEKELEQQRKSLRAMGAFGI